MITFRNAQLEDYEAFNKLYIRKDYLGEKEWIGTAMEKDRYIKHIQNEDIVLAVLNGTVIGYCLVQAFDDGICELISFYINSEYRGKGYSRAFLSHIESLAKSCGMKKIRLMSYNMKTDRFWERMKYVSVNYTDEYEKILL